MKIGRVLPVYPLTDGIAADLIRKTVVEALTALPQIKDPLPTDLKNLYSLMGLKEAIANIHYPENSDLLTHARRRLVFDEFFFLQLGFLQRRHKQHQTQTSASFNPSGQLIERFNAILPSPSPTPKKGSFRTFSKT